MQRSETEEANNVGTLLIDVNTKFLDIHYCTITKQSKKEKENLEFSKLSNSRY
jgi:hypothetical protein